jgi:cob(I)alamin adenosyltransferase
LIHIYTGNGKGKTTAATGLAVRAAGRNKKVVFAQFLKSGESGELVSLEKLGIALVHSGKKFGWVRTMDDETKVLCKNAQEAILSRIEEIVRGSDVDVIILDEVLDAVSVGMLDENHLKTFLSGKSARTEIIITGRPVPPWLFEIADYLSDVTKVKHPFDSGIKAREGIEF